MLAHRPGVLLAQAVVQPLVVGVVEALLLQRPFHVPVDLGHETGSRDACSRTARSPAARRVGPDAPGAFEHVGQDQHRHVAADAVALPGDSLQLADHRLLQVRVAVVELQRVGPAGEVRIAAVGEHQRPVFRLTRSSSAAQRARSVLAAMDEVLRMLFDPGMIEAHVIRHKIEHQLQAALAQPRRAAGPAPRRRPDRDARCSLDREPRTGDVLVLEVGQRCGFAPPLGIAREIACAAGPVCQTLRSQTQSKPSAARRSSSASGISSSVAAGPASATAPSARRGC